MRNLHAEITSKILAQLKTGVAPWRKPWSTQRTAYGSPMPHNAVTGRPYSGVNILLLWDLMSDRGWGPKFLTFKQAKAAGGNVKKGEHGTMVIFVKKLIVKDKKDPKGEERKAISFLRHYTVFNVAQCEGLSDKVTGTVQAPMPIDRNERDPLVDEYIQATGVKIVEGHKAAYLGGAFDRIEMPILQAFKSSDAYYSTLFHEMGHWTGHESRMNRNLTGRFGDRSYAAEELIAELSSAFVCAEFGIDMEEAPAAYIDHWVSLLEAREDAIVSAAAAASKAVEWLRGKVSAEEADEDEEALEAA